MMYYKRPLKKLMWGDYYNPSGEFAGNRFSDAAPYAQLGSGLINAVDAPSKYGVRSGGGAALSGALSGFGAGAALGPPGMIAGAIIGAGASLLQNNKAKKEEARIKAEEERVKLASIRNYSEGVLSTFPSFGVTEAKYGGKLKMYPMGGKLPYPTDGSETEQLASNMAVYEGDTHEQGGIELDTNQDGSPEVEIEDAEVIKDDYVLSDRISPSKLIRDRVKGLGINIKDNDTYASLAERFGKKKGEYEEKLSSTRIGEVGTAKLMIQQLDEAVDALFQDQQNQKQMKNIGGYYKMGGKLKKYATGDPIRDAKGNIFDPNEAQLDITRRVNDINFDAQGNEVYFDDIQRDITSHIDEYVPKEIPQTPRFTTSRPGFGETFRNNLGNTAVGLGFLANQAQINKLETQYTPDLVRTPNYNFTSRLPYLKGAVAQSFRTASQGIAGSSAQDNQALKANLYAKSLQSLNQATAEEFAREDAFKRDYNQSLLRTDLVNTQVKNQARFASMDNRNQRRSLTQQNIDSALRGVQGNQAMKEARELDWVKSKIELAKSGNRGVDKRFLEQTFTPRERRLYFGKY
jgi:hypothetical protein